MPGNFTLAPCDLRELVLNVLISSSEILNKWIILSEMVCKLQKRDDKSLIQAHEVGRLYKPCMIEL